MRLLACSIILFSFFSFPRDVRAQCTYEWAPIADAGFDGAINALLVHDGVLYAGGDFTTAGAASSQGIARFNGHQWTPVGEGVDGQVLALVSLGDSLFAGGRFSSAGEVTSQAIARWDGAQWHSLPEGFFYVDELAVLGDQLFASGEWLTPGRPEVVARLGADAWEVLDNREFGWVSDMAVCGDVLCVASYNEVFTWDGVMWSTVGQFELNVYALGHFDGKLVAAPTVQSGDDYAAFVVSWNGLEWKPLGSTLVGYTIENLTAYHGMLVASGAFLSAVWDGTTWDMLPEAADFGYVSAALPVGRTLLMGGEFFTFPSDHSSFLSEWSPSGSPGDSDGDLVVNLSDASAWVECSSAPAPEDRSAVVSKECLCDFNADGDADVDLGDFATFQAAFSP